MTGVRYQIVEGPNQQPLVLLGDAAYDARDLVAGPAPSQSSGRAPLGTLFAIRP